MKRDEIIRRLQALPYSPEEYWVTGYAAHVLHGEYCRPGVTEKEG